MASSEASKLAAPIAFLIHTDDNVATMLYPAEPGRVAIRGCGREMMVAAHQHIDAGHKIAVRAIFHDMPIVKFGVVIGIASAPVEPGAWVHLHNCRSQVDDRSGAFDLHTGRPEDTRYE